MSRASCVGRQRPARAGRHGERDLGPDAAGRGLDQLLDQGPDGLGVLRAPEGEGAHAEVRHTPGPDGDDELVVGGLAPALEIQPVPGRVDGAERPLLELDPRPLEERDERCAHGQVGPEGEGRGRGEQHEAVAGGQQPHPGAGDELPQREGRLQAGDPAAGDHDAVGRHSARLARASSTTTPRPGASARTGLQSSSAS